MGTPMGRETILLSMYLPVLGTLCLLAENVCTALTLCTKKTVSLSLKSRYTGSNSAQEIWREKKKNRRTNTT